MQHKWFYGRFPIKDHQIWQGNIKKEHVKLIQTHDNVFWNIWGKWAQISFYIPENAQEIAIQPTWCNSLILHAGLSFFHKN